MRYYVTLPSGREIPVDVKHLPTGQVHVEVEGRSLSADSFGHGPSTHVLLRPTPADKSEEAPETVARGVDLWLEGTPPDVGVVANGRRFYARVESERTRELRAAAKARGPEGDGLVTSPMPGRVLKVLVNEGDAVSAGSPLVVVEAMKMENELGASRGGTVKKIYVAPGATVEMGARLIEVA